MINISESNDNSHCKITGIMIDCSQQFAAMENMLTIRRITRAHNENKLVTGISEVFIAATHNQCRLLVTEKDYINTLSMQRSKTSYKTDPLFIKPFYIKDEIDEIIEKVFESGGDVEFDENHTLEEYNQIALIIK